MSEERAVDVLVEIPKGSRSKYELDPKTGGLRLDRVLHSSVHYPADYGFILDTLARDGDHLDVLVVVEEPAVPGSLHTVRPIGILDMEDHRGPDEEILAVPAGDPRFDPIRALADLPKHWLLEIQTFFDTYKELESEKGASVRGWRGAEEAWRAIEAARAAFRAETSRSRQGGGPRGADISQIFDLGDSGGSDVAQRKDEYVGEAVAAELPRPQRWIGVDFSGDHTQWDYGEKASRVWIGLVTERPGGVLVLSGLRRVQQLPEKFGRDPFDRLANWLKQERFLAAAIDAPFSIPAVHMGERSHRELLEQVGSLACRDRPFPEAKSFVRALTGRDELHPAKPYRHTEACWRGKGINVRSTLFAKSRGGAAMTAACLKLLHQAGGPIWPWSKPPVGRLLVEAFPAAQLYQWRLPHEGYGDTKPMGKETREQIAQAIRKRIDVGDHGEKLLSSADALDSVLCAFAAIAVTERKLALQPEGLADREGWIAVHE